MKLIKVASFAGALLLTCYIAYYSIQRNTLAPREDSAKTLIVGTCDDYPPFTFNKDGKIIGFDIDVINELARRMTQKIIVKNMSFDVLLLETQRGTIDVIAAGLTPTEEREKKVSFAMPHLQNDALVVLTKKESPITSLKDMEGKIIGVNQGYTADYYLSSQPNITIERIENVAQAILALKQNKINGFATAQSVIQPFLKTETDDAFIVSKLPTMGDGYAFAVSKKNPELLKRINATLFEMQEDGTLSDIAHKWEFQ